MSWSSVSPFVTMTSWRSVAAACGQTLGAYGTAYDGHGVGRLSYWSYSSQFALYVPHVTGVAFVIPVKTFGVFGWSGLPRPFDDAGQLSAMKLSHENQSKYGRNCSEVALCGGFGGIGTFVGMLPLMTTGGIDGNFGGAAAAAMARSVANAIDFNLSSFAMSR